MSSLGAVGTQDERGAFHCGNFVISHRDTNSILTIQMGQGCVVTAKPGRTPKHIFQQYLNSDILALTGVMVAMSPTITLKGAVKFSMKKLLTGGQMASSTYTGTGELLLAPNAIGDIRGISLDGNQMWNIGKDAFLAATEGIVRETKSQGIGKAFFSGEGLFIYKISGRGVIWVTSFGAIMRKDVRIYSLGYT
jgi:hypothetical protein